MFALRENYWIYKTVRTSQYIAFVRREYMKIMRGKPGAMLSGAKITQLE
jgi:hypothetical protein